MSRRRYFIRVVVPVLVLILWSVVGAAKIEVPPARGYVTDTAGVIDSGREQRIIALVGALKRATGAEIAVLTVRTTGDEPIEDYAMAAAEQYRPGRSDRDNGVMFVVATEDRKLFIATGYGVEGVLPDGKVGGIEDEEILPWFKQGQYGEGILRGVAALAAVIDPAHASSYRTMTGAPVTRTDRFSSRRVRPLNGPLSYLLMGVFGVIFLYLLIRHPRLLLLMLLMNAGGRGGFGGGGGSFGGGFGGFGGGGFGGGGAGRSW